LPVILNVGLQTDVTEVAVAISQAGGRHGNQRGFSGKERDQAGERELTVPVRVVEGVDLVPADVHSEVNVVAALGPQHVLLYRELVLQEAEWIRDIRAQTRQARHANANVLPCREGFQYIARGDEGLGFGFERPRKGEAERVQKCGRENVALLNGGELVVV